MWLQKAKGDKKTVLGIQYSKDLEKRRFTTRGKIQMITTAAFSKCVFNRLRHCMCGLYM